MDWVPQKLGGMFQPLVIQNNFLTSSISLDIPLRLPESDTLLLDKYLGKGQQPGEELLPSEASSKP